MWRSTSSAALLLAGAMADCRCPSLADSGPSTDAAKDAGPAACAPSATPSCGDGQIDVAFLFGGGCGDWERSRTGYPAFLTGVYDALPEADVRMESLYQGYGLPACPWPIDCGVLGVSSFVEPENIACFWGVYAYPDEEADTPAVTCFSHAAAAPYLAAAPYFASSAGIYGSRFAFDRPDAVTAVVVVSSREDCSVLNPDPTLLANALAGGFNPGGCIADVFNRVCEYERLDDPTDSFVPSGPFVLDWMRACHHERDLFLAAITGLDKFGNSEGPLLTPRGTRNILCESNDGLTRAMPAPHLVDWVRSLPPEQHYVGNLCDDDLASHFYAIGYRLGELARPCGS